MKVIRQLWSFGAKNDCFKVLNVKKEEWKNSGTYQGPIIDDIYSLPCLFDTKSYINVLGQFSSFWVQRRTVFGSKMWIRMTDNAQIYEKDSQLKIFVYCHSYSEQKVI